MRGIDLKRTIKRSLPRAIIILMTGSVPADYEMKAVKEHALFHLVKPVDPVQLKTIMEEFLGKRIGTYQDCSFLVAGVCREKILHESALYEPRALRHSPV